MATTTRQTVYKIRLDNPGEYLLIENRQPIGMDYAIPPGSDNQRGGLVVYHIDEVCCK